LAPEEVEFLVTCQIESSINGKPGLKSLRSSPAVGIASIETVFSSQTDIHRARQLVT
jgi:Cu/Ag efflux pump CusA